MISCKKYIYLKAEKKYFESGLKVRKGNIKSFFSDSDTKVIRRFVIHFKAFNEAHSARW